MIEILLIVLTLSTVMLTIAFLGALRGVAELRLRLQGHGRDLLTARMRVEEGRPLPPVLAPYVPAVGNFVVAFLSSQCEACWRLSGDLRSFTEAPVFAALLGADVTSLRERLDGSATEVPASAGTDAAREMNIEVTPVVVFFRDRFVVGSSWGDAAGSEKDIREVWDGLAPVS